MPPEAALQAGLMLVLHQACLRDLAGVRPNLIRDPLDREVLCFERPALQDGRDSSPNP